MNIKNLKPFDIKAALAGKAVKLRNGDKAYVRHHETELDTDEHRKLVGYTSIGIILSWREDGRFIGSHLEESRDIIGMYPETRKINGFEVPVPGTQELEYKSDYYLASTASNDFYSEQSWTGHFVDMQWLERGLVFLNKEDAVANAKAMLGIDPHSKDES